MAETAGHVATRNWHEQGQASERQVQGLDPLPYTKLEIKKLAGNINYIIAPQILKINDMSYKL